MVDKTWDQSFDTRFVEYSRAAGIARLGTREIHDGHENDFCQVVTLLSRYMQH